MIMIMMMMMMITIINIIIIIIIINIKFTRADLLRRDHEVPRRARRPLRLLLHPPDQAATVKTVGINGYYI